MAVKTTKTTTVTHTIEADGEKLEIKVSGRHIISASNGYYKLTVEEFISFIVNYPQEADELIKAVREGFKEH